MKKGISILYLLLQKGLLSLIMGICVLFIPISAYSQAVTPASGGTGLSADDFASNAYTAITGMEIQETAPGQLSSGEIRLRVPSGFRWDTGGADPTATVSSPKGSRITVTFQSRTETDVVFQLSGNSVGPPPNNPHTITFSNLRVSPSRGTPLASGQISNVGSAAPGGQTNYGSLSFVAGADAKVRVEDAPDNSGSVVEARDLEAGTPLTVYSNVRDQFNNFKRNADATWTLEDITDGATTWNLSANNGSATLTGNLTGSATIRPAFGGLAYVKSGTITVTPADGTTLVITTQPTGQTGTATAGQAFSPQPVIEIRDDYGNVVTDNSFTKVTATRSRGSGTLQGTTTETANSGIVDFSGTNLRHNIANDVSITFSSSGFPSVTSDTFTVLPADPSGLEFKVEPPNGIRNIALNPAPEIQLVDPFGNYVSQSGNNITVEKVSGSGNINGTTTLSSNNDGVAVFTDIKFNQNGTYVIRGTSPGLDPTPDSREIIIGDAGTLANFEIEIQGGGSIPFQEAGSPFDIQITAVDGEGNVLDGNQGRDNFSGKVFISSSGNLIAGGDSTASFTNGVLSTHSVNISTAGETTISATGPDDRITGTSNAFIVNPTTANADSSFFAVSEDTLIADGNNESSITVTLEDQYGNKLTTGGDNVTISSSGTGTLSGVNDNGDGTYTATLTAPTNVGSTTITADVNGSIIQDSGSNQAIEINFIPGALSTFLIEDENGGSIPDQTAGSSFKIKITAQDANGNIVTDFDGSGSTVEITSNGTISSGGETTAPFTDGILSSHSITITSAGQVTIEARKTASSETGTSNTFTVAPGDADPATSAITAGRSFLENNGTDNTTVTIQLKDEFGNNLISDGDNINLSTTAGSLGPTSGSSTSGTFTSTLTAGTSMATATITGSVNGQNITDDAVIEITRFNEWQGDAGGRPDNATDWTNTQNWSLGSLPTTGQVVVIPAGLSSYPTLNDDNPDDPVLDFLVIESGANVTIDGRSMTINEEISGGGSLSGNNSTFNLNGDVDLDNFIAGSSTINMIGNSHQIVDGDFTAGDLNIQNNVAVDGYFEAFTSLTIDTDQTLTMEPGSQLVSLGDVTINGSLVGNNSRFSFGGDINGSNISLSDTDVNLNGTTAQQINGIDQIKSFTIDNTAGVTVNNDLTVSDTLTITNGTLTIASGFSFVSNVKEGNTSNIRMLREVSGSPGWRMIAPPLKSTYEDFLDGTVTQGYDGASENNTFQPNVLYYDESHPGTDNQRWRAPDRATDPLTPGRGLFVYFFGDVPSDDRYNNPLPDTLSIQGAENDGDGTAFTFPVTYTADADTGFNLIGNPFAATIDWDDGNWTKENMDNVLYVWDPATNDYLTWNGISGSLGDGLIKPFQGFWVKANGNGTPILTVNKSSKTTGGQFHGKSKKEPAAIEFKVEAGNLSKTTHITLSEDGRNNKDPRDAYRLLPFDTDTYLELYTTLSDGTQLAINNLARAFGKKISIPLHINGFKDGKPIDSQYTLSWPEFGDVPDAWTLILEDKKNGQEVDLRKNTFYSFNLSPSKQKATVNTIENFRLIEGPATMAKAKSSAENRFVLHINPGADGAGIPDEYSLGINYPNPFGESTTIKYNTPVEGYVELLIFDILGRKVKTILDERRPADFHEIEWNPAQLASGVYICVMRAGGKQFAKKMTYVK